MGIGVREEYNIYFTEFKEVSGVDHIYIEEDTVIEETTIVDTITTSHPVGSNAISIINLDAN